MMHSSTLFDTIYDDDAPMITPTGVYTTEVYPEAFIPSSNSSSQTSSPNVSPTIAPREHFEDKDLNGFSITPPPARIIRKPSKTRVANRKSVLLDPIVEEQEK